MICLSLLFSVFYRFKYWFLIINLAWCSLHQWLDVLCRCPLPLEEFIRLFPHLLLICFPSTPSEGHHLILLNVYPVSFVPLFTSLSYYFFSDFKVISLYQSSIVMLSFSTASNLLQQLHLYFYLFKITGCSSYFLSDFYSLVLLVQF